MLPKQLLVQVHVTITTSCSGTCYHNNLSAKYDGVNE